MAVNSGVSVSRMSPSKSKISARFISRLPYPVQRSRPENTSARSATLRRHRPSPATLVDSREQRRNDYEISNQRRSGSNRARRGRPSLGEGISPVFHVRLDCEPKHNSPNTTTPPPPPSHATPSKPTFKLGSEPRDQNRRTGRTRATRATRACSTSTRQRHLPAARCLRRTRRREVDVAASDKLHDGLVGASPCGALAEPLPDSVPGCLA